jgi:hypothetical protein
VRGHEENIFSRSEMWKQSAILNDITDSAAELRNIGRRQRRAIELNCSAIRFEQPNDQTQQRGFSAAAWSEQHRGLATPEREIRGVKRGRGSERFADPAKLNERAHNLLLIKLLISAKIFSGAAVAASLCEA